ncbi:MAG TPA: PspC domain-containing protein, partial [Pseudonocardiaceae bacterium]|nr:PspC domain-containing protein [Pseudonocardiaceae bacterium]
MLCPVSTTQGSSSINFEETVKDFVATRPRRPLHGRVVAGVAAGIGRRYGIDPVIVRIALVVSAFYGGGVTVYLLGWLFLAREDDEVSGFEGLIGRGQASMSRAFA